MRLPLRSGILAGLAAAATAIAVGLPAPRPLLPVWSVALALPTPPLLFAAVASRLPRPRLHGARSILVAALVLVPYATCEELFWRGLVLGASSSALTPLGALAFSSVGFAYVHRSRRHAVSGLVFGALYVLTGGLLAPIAAHGLYNLVVWCDRNRARGSSVADGAAPPAELGCVSKSYGDALALDRVDLELRTGEIVGLLGPNGAGKTTATAILLGLRRPDSGRARLFGRDPREPAARRLVGSLPQDFELPATLTVREILRLVRAHYADPVSVDDVLDRHGLVQLARRQGGGLSGGERRRVGLALAMVGRPRVLLLDEPSAGLDTASRRVFRASLAAHRDQGGSALLTTHDLEEASALADRVVILSGGRVLAAGAVDEMRARLTAARVTLRTSRLPELVHAQRVERVRGGVRVETDDVAALLRELVTRDVPLDGIEVRQPTLEDAVLALSTESERGL